MNQPPAPEDLATTTRPAPPETPQQAAGSTQPPSDAQPQRGTQPTGEIGAGILGPDPMPPITDAERERMSRGLLETVAEFEAEHGPFSEEELARARANLNLGD